MQFLPEALPPVTLPQSRGSSQACLTATVLPTTFPKVFTIFLTFTFKV